MMNIKWAVFFSIASFMVLGNSSIFCQQTTAMPYKYTYRTDGFLHIPPGSTFPSFTLTEPTSSLSEQRELRYFMTNAPQQLRERRLYRQADMAFFCRLEVKIENAAKIPVKFRLGDVQYVDYLEGKFEAWRYAY